MRITTTLACCAPLLLVAACDIGYHPLEDISAELHLQQGGEPAGETQRAARGVVPSLVVRDLGASGVTSGVEVGLPAHAYVPFERDPATGQTALRGLLPLNLASDGSTRTAFVLRLDAPRSTYAADVVGEALRLTWLDAAGARRVVALEHATETDGASGSVVRVQPVGVLPQGATLELELDLGVLAGLPAGRSLESLTARVDVALDPVAHTPSDGADAVLAAFEDADWYDPDAAGPGIPAGPTVDGVGAGSGFPGGGGPGGDFDWVVRVGETIILDTSSDQIVGGPGGIPVAVQTVTNGYVFVRDMLVQTGGTLIVVGPNPCRVFATGTITIDGRVSVDGGDSQGVGTLNTTNQPEPGAAGRAGGGRGGTGSPFTSQSSPRGGSGAGAFDTPNLGGEGGETSYSLQDREARRGAGGGGGRFGRDVLYRWNGGLIRSQTLTGMDAEPGFPGGPGGTGAVSQTARAEGGAIAPDVFTDGNPRNDHVGLLQLDSGGSVLGELEGLWAGSGGGAGGDAVNSATFPLTPFSPAGDEKGAGGGAGAGALALVALDDIVVGQQGRITADGGHGGGGENTIFFDRVGGGSGGGSGGMIVLEAGGQVRIEAAAQQGTGTNNALAYYTDDPGAARHPDRPISARGGQGGAGRENRCGANETGETLWRNDAIPSAAFEGRTDVPPLGSTPNNNGFLLCNEGGAFLDPEGTTPGAGGDGGPGVIQVHVPDAVTNFQLPASSGGDPTFSFVPPPVGWRDGEFVGRLEPRFAGLSSATSRWFPLGAGSWDPLTQDDQPLAFHAPGVGADGYVDGAGLSAPIVGPLAVTPGAAHRVTLAAAGADELYLDNPLLLRGGALVLDSGTASATFEVVDASHDAAGGTLTVDVDPRGPSLAAFAAGSAVEATLHSRAVRTLVAGRQDALPAGYRVRLAYDAARAGQYGAVDPATAYSGATGRFTSDPADLGGEPWQFLRFRVEFERPLDGLSTPFAVRGLQVPFRF